MQNDATFVDWFRNSAPYIHAHRHRTFVIFFGGEALLDNVAPLIHDFALLCSLGIRLVLVHGIRPQIDSRLQQQQLPLQFKENRRITDKATLQYVKEAAGIVRVEIEALLSMGLTNSPMAGAKIKVASGNFVMARPLGVIDGVDFNYTGVVRRIEHVAMTRQLDQHNVVLISPLGYSPSGEVFNLTAEEVAMEVAIALQADKLILLTEQSCVYPDTQQPIRQLTTLETEDFLQRYPKLDANCARILQVAQQSCKRGVKRVHLLNRQQDGALLLELFTRDGIGTLISSTPFETLRSAHLNDIGGILELIRPLEQQGVLVKRSAEKLETQIGDYTVIERDGLIIGCAAFHVFDSDTAMMACLAVHQDYQKAARGQRLFEHLLNQATQRQIKTLFVLTTQTTHWFLERGFLNADRVPPKLQAYYNPQRNSKILYKSLHD